MELLEGAATVNNAAAVPVIVAIVQMFKMIGDGSFLNRYAPFISVGVGIAIAFLTNGDQLQAHETILAGILYGLSASGLYSGTKHTAHAIKGIE